MESKHTLQGNEKRGFHRPLWYVAAGLLLWLGLLIAHLVVWSRNYFGVDINEIVATTWGPVQGTGGGMTRGILYGLLLPAAATVLAVVLLCVFLARWSRDVSRRGAPDAVCRRAHAAFLAAGVVLLFAALVYADAAYDLRDYLRTTRSSTTMYEQYYADPETVSVTAPAQRKNLICIYAESMETTYASREAGGAQAVNYIPRLTELAAQNINFSGNGALGGFYSSKGTNWTMGALLSSSAGVPYRLPAGKSIGDVDYFPGLVTLGDILAENGYRQEFFFGSEGDFAGREEFFRLHGNFDVCDYYEAVRRGYAPEGYFRDWGFEDAVLFAGARQELAALAAEDGPFHFSLLTVDLHAPGGYVCDVCGDEHPESRTGTVAACSDRQIADFIDWCLAQDFAEDTVIVVMGDHPRMDLNLVRDVDYRDREVYDCFIGSAVQPQPGNDIKHRTFTAMDLFPTILAALGFVIEGDRLGLGTNLFSGRATLAEEQGLDWIDSESLKTSAYYTEHFTK